MLLDTDLYLNILNNGGLKNVNRHQPRQSRVGFFFYRNNDRRPDRRHCHSVIPAAGAFGTPRILLPSLSRSSLLPPSLPLQDHVIVILPIPFSSLVPCREHVGGSGVLSVARHPGRHVVLQLVHGRARFRAAWEMSCCRFDDGGKPEKVGGECKMQRVC